MLSIRCPNCREEVILPAGWHAETVVRCPMCLEEYPLGKVLAKLPPMLVVVSQPAAAASAESVAPVRSASMGGMASGGGVADYRLADEKPAGGGYGGGSYSPNSTGYGPAGGLASTTGARSEPAKGYRSRAAARPAKRPVNVLWEGFKIVGGGLAGLCLAMLILWWGFGRDPLDMAPRVHAYAPWLVPTKLRPGYEPPVETPPAQDKKTSPEGSRGASGAKAANARQGGSP